MARAVGMLIASALPIRAARAEEEHGVGKGTLPRLPRLARMDHVKGLRRQLKAPRVAAATLGIISLVVCATVGLSLDIPVSARTGRQGVEQVLPVTQPDPRWADFATAQQPLAPVVAALYASHGPLPQDLGSPITAAIPVRGGWIQFFVAGALFVPGASPEAVGQARGQAAAREADAQDQAIAQLVQSGIADPASGGVRLPLLQALIAAGSTLPIGGQPSSLTYVGIRHAAEPAALVAAPAWYARTGAVGPNATFIAERRRNGVVVGHLVPEVIWQALVGGSLAPNGWRRDLGQPITEALPVVATTGGQSARLTVQAFDHALVVVSDSNGAVNVRMYDVGRDYLETFGPPTPHLRSAPVWLTTGATLRANASAAAAAVGHAGEHFPLSLSGDAQWVDDVLWYRVTWQAGRHAGTAWVNAAAVDYSAPSPYAMPSAEFDVLAPALAAYLNRLGYRVGVAVYDETRGMYYDSNANMPVITGSTIKFPIMLTLLWERERQGREPSATEMTLLTNMIEHSDNEAAGALYYGTIGGAQAVANFMRYAGVSGLSPTPDAFGWSTVTPLAMVRLLTLLHDGAILTAPDRALALHLMESIQPDQRHGVGFTAPDGATVAMKDGWVPGPDGLWVADTIGIVTLGHETYMIAVYTQDNSSLDDGWETAEHVCGAVASALA